MRSNKTPFVVAMVLIVGAIGYLSIPDSGKVATPTSEVLTHRFQANSNDEQAKRIVELEAELRRVSDRLAMLTELAKQNRDSLDESEGAETSDYLNDENDEIEGENSFEPPYIDPLSPEGIAIQDEIQDNYISQVDDIYLYEDVDPEWAEETETTVLTKLSDLDRFAVGRGSGLDESGESPDIVVSNFECRTNLCGTEIIAASEEEMIAYQHFMVAQTKRDLPSIVFSTIQPYGNKFRMKAYLARDEYEFPSL